MVGQLSLQAAFQGQFDQPWDQTPIAGDLDLTCIDLG
jgi:hypothetical protein